MKLLLDFILAAITMLVVTYIGHLTGTNTDFAAGWFACTVFFRERWLYDK